IPAFFVAIFLVGKFIVPPILNLCRNFQVSAPLYSIALSIALITAYLTKEIFGIEPIIGAYLIGLMMSMTPHHHAIYERLESISLTIFVPVFFGSIGLVAVFDGFAPYIGLFSLLLVVAIITKWYAGIIGGRITGL